MCQAKAQISLGIRLVWSESSLSTWRIIGSLATHWAHSEDSDQTGRMPRLIWGFAGSTCHFVGFVMMWLKCCLHNMLIDIMALCIKCINIAFNSLPNSLVFLRLICNPCCFQGCGLPGLWLEGDVRNHQGHGRVQGHHHGYRCWPWKQQQTSQSECSL